MTTSEERRERGDDSSGVSVPRPRSTRPAASAGGRVERKFGTVLTLFKDEARRRLWDRDFSIVPVDDTEADGTERRLWAAARQLEILLDGVLAESRTELGHLLDPAVERALDNEERQVTMAISDLEEKAAQAPADSPA